MIIRAAHNPDEKKILLSAGPAESDRGIYILVMELARSCWLNAGRLPPAQLDSGTYLYVGRAQKNLMARIRRHLRSHKKIFWHIDTFLQRAQIIQVWIIPGCDEECGISRHLTNLLPDGSMPIKNFGSSDCRCPGHLFFVAPPAERLAGLRQTLADIEVIDHENGL